jgi:putative ABC transport system ATP-binding protein
VLPDPLRVVCHGVSKTYRSPAGSVEALHSLDTVFEPGRLTVLVGPSGSGKSTLLRLLAGLDAVDEGLVRVGEIDVAALQGRRLRSYRRSCIAYVAQRAADNLVPHLTLEEHVGPANRGLLVELGLERRLGSRAARLSGGEQARAALGVALLRGTPVVLADEPTAEVDHATAELVLEALR